MPIRVKCEGCKKTLSVKDHLAGKKIKCPVCQNVLAVPMASPSKEPAPLAVPPTSAKKPAVATKPALKSKPAVEKPDSNGASSGNGEKAKGTPAAPPPLELPPENVEAEALAAFADEPPPPEETEAPTFVEFKCQWCDEQVKLPIELAGKQAQCPNEECRRIVKVPLPKATEKKDWRKMDKKGPSAAILNQPEQLENAWGTEDATKARQDSLAKAGVIELPAKTRPRDLFDKIYGVFKVGFLVIILAGGGFGLWHLVSAKQQQNTIKDLEQLVKGDKGVAPKIKSGTLLSAEAHRTLGLLHLRLTEKNPAFKAQKALQGASFLEFEISERNPGLNEQLFLIDVAISQIELGGNDADLIGNTKLSWEDTRSEIEATLNRIKNPDIQVMALREVGARLFAKGQAELAIGLTVKPSAADAQGKRPAAYRQQIALIFARGEPATLKNLPKLSDPPTAKELTSAHVRIGYAEGHARKESYDKAMDLVKIGGQAKDRLEASLGAAAVTLQLGKDKDQAARFVKEALTISKEKDANPNDWQMLQLVRLAAHTEDAEVVKDLARLLRHPAFKLRAELEIFLALCEKSSGRVDADKLAAIEALETPAKNAKVDPTSGTTLALAWTVLARQQSLSAGRNAFNARVAAIELAPEMVERIRPMIDVGSCQGALK